MQIEQFVQNHNSNGSHTLQDLNCAQNMCRMRVISSDRKSWASLMSQMIAEDWYTTYTLKRGELTLDGAEVFYLMRGDH